MRAARGYRDPGQEGGRGAPLVVAWRAGPAWAEKLFAVWGGALLLFGLVVLVLVAPTCAGGGQPVEEASIVLVVLALLVVPGAVAALQRHGVTVDCERRVVTLWWGLRSTPLWRQSVHALDRVASVRVVRGGRSASSREADRFSVCLGGPGPDVALIEDLLESDADAYATRIAAHLDVAIERAP